MPSAERLFYAKQVMLWANGEADGAVVQRGLCSRSQRPHTNVHLLLPHLSSYTAGRGALLTRGTEDTVSSTAVQAAGRPDHK